MDSKKSDRETLTMFLHRDVTGKGFELRETTDGEHDIETIYVGTVDNISDVDFEEKVVSAVAKICEYFNWHCFARHFPWEKKQHGMFSVVYNVPYTGVGRINNG